MRDYRFLCDRDEKLEERREAAEWAALLGCLWALFWLLVLQ